MSTKCQTELRIESEPASRPPSARLGGGLLQRQSYSQIEPARVPPTNGFTILHLGHDFSRVPVRTPVPAVVQPKFTIGQPGDKYEQEADRVAEQIIRMPEPRVQHQVEPDEEEPIQAKPLADQITPLVQRQVEQEEEEGKETLQTRSIGSQITPLIQRQAEPDEKEEQEEPVQAKLVDGARVQRQEDELEEELIQTEPPSEDKRVAPGQELPEGLEEDGRVLLKGLSPKTPQVSDGDIRKRLYWAKGRGKPLSDKDRSFLESKFGVDFSCVRVHTDNNAVQMAQALSAAAFVNGRDIYFNSGRYNPDSQLGKRLLAHELTHVIQQGSSGHDITPVTTNSILISSQSRQPRLQISRLDPHHGGVTWLQRQTEVHVNLRQPQKVKLFQKGKGDTVFSPVSAGRATARLIRLKPYYIIKRKDPTKKLGRWGLQYFATFYGGIGFHSNIAYPSRRTLCAEGLKRYCIPKSKLGKRLKWILRVDGKPRSHGCVRMKHTDAPVLFNAVSNGTPVRVYKRKRWRKPAWSP